MNTGPHTSSFSIPDAGCPDDLSKRMSLYADFAKEAQRALFADVSTPFSDSGAAAVQKLQAEFAAAITPPGACTPLDAASRNTGQNAHLYAATMAHLRGALVGPAILNTSNAQAVFLVETLGSLPAFGRQGDRTEASARFFGSVYTDAASAIQAGGYVRLSSAAGRATVEEAPVPITLEVERFCAENKLTEHLKSGIVLARKYFSPGCQIRVYLDTDPEDGDEYVVLEVSSARDPAIDVESYFKYSEEWSALVEWPSSRMILLDLKAIRQA
jgi:hypothetical protein